MGKLSFGEALNAIPPQRPSKRKFWAIEGYKAPTKNVAGFCEALPLKKMAKLSPSALENLGKDVKPVKSKAMAILERQHKKSPEVHRLQKPVPQKPGLKKPISVPVKPERHPLRPKKPEQPLKPTVLPRKPEGSKKAEKPFKPEVVQKPENSSKSSVIPRKPEMSQKAETSSVKPRRSEEAKRPNGTPVGLWKPAQLAKFVKPEHTSVKHKIPSPVLKKPDLFGIAKRSGKTVRPSFIPLRPDQLVNKLQNVEHMDRIPDEIDVSALRLPECPLHLSPIKSPKKPEETQVAKRPSLVCKIPLNIAKKVLEAPKVEENKENLKPEIPKLTLKLGKNGAFQVKKDDYEEEVIEQEEELGSIKLKLMAKDLFGETARLWF